MEVNRLFEIPEYQQAIFPQEVALAEKVHGKWKHYSTAEVIEQTRQMSKGLLALGIEPGDTIAIISNNRPQWNFTDLGALQIGAVIVPIYPTISQQEYAYIFNHAAIKLAFVSDTELLTKVQAIRQEVDSLQEVFTFDQIEGVQHWTAVLEAGKDISDEALANRRDRIAPDDLATIIYTSGTTGTPKGVMLSHDNILCNVKSVTTILPISHEHRVLSFLPLCHVFERMVCYLYQYMGASVYYAESLDPILLRDNMLEVKPHFFTTVPRLLEKVYEAIFARGLEMRGIRRSLFFWALDLGLRYQVDKEMGWWYDFRLSIARKLVFSKWREALGGELIGIVTGAAALSPKLCKVFSAGGMSVREGYGQTETSPVISLNRFEPGGTLEGSVGIPIPGVEVRIAENGEICVKGPNVMLGYYKNPAATAETIDTEGWLHTGDVGKIIAGKFLVITDRIKELFKTSGGKYVAPQPIENRFKESFFIEQMMVVGENRKFVSALIVPSFSYLENWCQDQGIPYSDRRVMLTHPKVLAHFQEICDDYNQEFSHIEQIKRFTLIPDEWTVDSGEMTATLKLKRRVIQKRYQAYVDKIYAATV